MRHHTMKADTLDGLRDTLDDLEKQLEKAEEKYETLKRRASSVRDAIVRLSQDDGQARADGPQDESYD